MVAVQDVCFSVVFSKNIEIENIENTAILPAERREEVQGAVLYKTHWGL